jgi:hypothetical protein
MIASKVEAHVPRGPIEFVRGEEFDGDGLVCVDLLTKEFP